MDGQSNAFTSGFGKASPDVSMRMCSGGAGRASSASMVGTKSSATVQHKQPLESSTIFSSGQLSIPQPFSTSPSMPTLPNSLTMIASRFPLEVSSRCRSSVVLPAPRKPVMMVAGMRDESVIRRPP
jgi:hypothetical protein